MKWLLVAFLLLASPAFAHQAETGWAYGYECCSERDCRHAEPGEVTEESGGYRIRNTGELISYGSPKLRPSRDLQHHICQPEKYEGQTEMIETICLYIPALF